jgi:hypothetical protein
MNLKLITAATAVAFSLIACDSSSSSTGPETDNNTSTNIQGNVPGGNTNTPSNTPTNNEGTTTTTPADESVNPGIVCTGELSDNQWSATINTTAQGVSMDTKSTVTFSGSTMTTDNYSKMDMMSEDVCGAILLVSMMGDEEEDEDAALYGNVVGKSELNCDGSFLIMKEKRVKENVTAAEREAVYNDMMVECKDLRDGRKSIDEFMNED